MTFPPNLALLYKIIDVGLISSSLKFKLKIQIGLRNLFFSIFYPQIVHFITKYDSHFMIFKYIIHFYNIIFIFFYKRIFKK